MIIKNLKLLNYRNYKKLTIDFNNKINVFYGRNGVGKTNIVEAIYYLSLTKSFRTNDELELIKINEKESLIQGRFNFNSLIDKGIEIYLSKEGKKISINNERINKISDLASLINIIYFIPKDVLLLKDSPKNRRKFLDISISRVNKEYLLNLSLYSKVLKDRNNLLKEEVINKDLLDIYTSKLIEYSEKIYKVRKEYIDELNKVISKVYFNISKKEDSLKIIYIPLIDENSGNKNYYEELYQKYKNNEENDIKSKRTTIGIHLEDFYITLNNKNVGSYGSQGENRLSVLSLKLSQYCLVNEEKNKPIIILDDVLSELDEIHKNNLLNYLNNEFNQVFITSTTPINYLNFENYLIKDQECYKEVN